jgi:hypothetical protein
MATAGTYEIHTASRGPHWIGWVSRPGSQQPDNSIILVAATQEEAATRARAWANSTYNLQSASGN